MDDVGLCGRKGEEGHRVSESLSYISLITWVGFSCHWVCGGDEPFYPLRLNQAFLFLCALLVSFWFLCFCFCSSPPSTTLNI
jgi:hypothetical protein